MTLLNVTSPLLIFPLGTWVNPNPYIIKLYDNFFISTAVVNVYAIFISINY